MKQVTTLSTSSLLSSTNLAQQHDNAAQTLYTPTDSLKEHVLWKAHKPKRHLLAPGGAVKPYGGLCRAAFPNSDPLDRILKDNDRRCLQSGPVLTDILAMPLCCFTTSGRVSERAARVV